MQWPIRPDAEFPDGVYRYHIKEDMSPYTPDCYHGEVTVSSGPQPACPDTGACQQTFDAIAEWVATPGYRGCAFVNVLAETSEIDDTHRTITAGHKRDLVAHLARLAAPDHPNAPTWFPAALAAIVDGAIVHSTIFASAEPLDAARSAVHQLLETIPT